MFVYIRIAYSYYVREEHSLLTPQERERERERKIQFALKILLSNSVSYEHVTHDIHATL